MKEQIKTPEIELSDEEIANLSDAKFKTLVIGMFKELIEYSNSIKKTWEEMKVPLSEINKNLQGNNNGGYDTNIQITDVEHKEEINIQPEQKEEIRI